MSCRGDPKFTIVSASASCKPAVLLRTDLEDWASGIRRRNDDRPRPRSYKRISGHVLNVLSSVVMPLHKIDYYDEDEVAGASD